MHEIGRFRSELLKYLLHFQVLRIQSADGTKRVEVPDTGTLRELYDAVQATFGYPDDGFALYKERNCTKEVSSLARFYDSTITF